MDYPERPMNESSVGDAAVQRRDAGETRSSLLRDSALPTTPTRSAAHACAVGRQQRPRSPCAFSPCGTGPIRQSLARWRVGVGRPNSIPRSNRGARRTAESVAVATLPCRWNWIRNR